MSAPCPLCGETLPPLAPCPTCAALELTAADLEALAVSPAELEALTPNAAELADLLADGERAVAEMLADPALAVDLDALEADLRALDVGELPELEDADDEGAT